MAATKKKPRAKAAPRKKPSAKSPAATPVTLMLADVPGMLEPAPKKRGFWSRLFFG